MKQIIGSFFWFISIYIFSLSIAGAIVAYNAPVREHEDPKLAGYLASEKFGKAYGNYILLASLLASIIGTATQSLPGTKKEDR